MKRQPRMSAEDACALVDDDLPDGAYFAMAAELGGFDDVSDLCDELAEAHRAKERERKKIVCKCGQRFETEKAREQHTNAKHGGRP